MGSQVAWAYTHVLQVPRHSGLCSEAFAFGDDPFRTGVGELVASIAVSPLHKRGGALSESTTAKPPPLHFLTPTCSPVHPREPGIGNGALQSHVYVVTLKAPCPADAPQSGGRRDRSKAGREILLLWRWGYYVCSCPTCLPYGGRILGI